MISIPSASSTLQSINVTCTIHPESTADQCEVMAMADDGLTRTGNKTIATDNNLLWLYTYFFSIAT